MTSDRIILETIAKIDPAAAKKVIATIAAMSVDAWVQNRIPENVGIACVRMQREIRKRVEYEVRKTAKSYEEAMQQANVLNETDFPRVTRNDAYAQVMKSRIGSTDNPSSTTYLEALRTFALEWVGEIEASLRRK